MKKFLDITGLKTLVDWIKSKFNSVEKAQYVANRNFKKCCRGKKEKEVYIIGKAMKQSPIGQRCWYYFGVHNNYVHINFARIFMNQFTPPPHKVDDTNINLLLDGFDYNVTFYHNLSYIYSYSDKFSIARDIWSGYNIYYGSWVCRIPDMYGGAYNFAYIPSDSIITGDTNGRKSISFSVYLKYHEPNENDIIKSGKYKLEYSKHTGYYVKKLGIKKINIIHELIGFTFEYGENYDFILNIISKIGYGNKKSSCFLRKRCTKTVIKRGIQKGPMFKTIKSTTKKVDTGYYQLWCNYCYTTTHITDFVITVKNWDMDSNNPKWLKIIFP